MPILPIRLAGATATMPAKFLALAAGMNLRVVLLEAPELEIPVHFCFDQAKNCFCLLVNTHRENHQEMAWKVLEYLLDKRPSNVLLPDAEARHKRGVDMLSSNGLDFWTETISLLVYSPN